jgi:hypothetical protein
MKTFFEFLVSAIYLPGKNRWSDDGSALASCQKSAIMSVLFFVARVGKAAINLHNLKNGELCKKNFTYLRYIKTLLKAAD